MHFYRPVISFPSLPKSANQKGLWANNDIAPRHFFLVIYLPLCINPGTAVAVQLCCNNAFTDVWCLFEDGFYAAGLSVSSS